MLSATAPPPHIVEDCRGVLRLYSDGSIVRSDNENIFFIPSVGNDGKVEWKELQYDPFHDLQLRLYRPCTSNGPNLNLNLNLPVLFYFHSGGFCYGSCASPRYHNCCLRLAAQLNAIVISPDYRLAPEHRLPAAIEDGISAVEWLLAQAASTDPDPWLAEDADLSRIFVSGDSAGGNITHHLAIRFAPVVRNITGYVLLSPAFGGTQLTKSEAECPADAYLTLERTQQYWRLALPLGATADHPLVSPFAPGAPRLEEIEIGPTLVVVAGCDLLRDRQVEYAKRLQGWGKPVELVEIPDQQHSFFTNDPWSEPADELLRAIKRFMDETRQAGES